MACINPRFYRYRDAYTGEERICSYTCKKCVLCLKAQHDEINMRIRKTCEAYSSFVYDTLTVRDDAMEFVDWSDSFLDGDEVVHTDSLKMIKKYYPDFRFPVLPKKVFSAWFKRGREALRYKYGKDCPKLKYLVCQEYGPKSSRPHIHLIIFGVSKADYIEYFKNPWNEDYGFDYLEYIDFKDGKNQKDLECIASYISKYVNKGDFESPLVKDGLQPKPWRQLSHGIGEEYLSDSKFDWLKKPEYKFAKALSPFTYVPSYFLMYEEYRPQRVRLEGEISPNTDFIDKKNLHDNIKSLQVVFDKAGFAHAFPRYYRDKLLGYEPNLLKYAIQTALYQDACHCSYKKIQEFASSVGREFPRFVCSEAEALRLLGSSSPVLVYEYLASEKAKRRLLADGVKTKLKNHYKRVLYKKNSYLIS